MILEFNDKHYINVEDISALRKFTHEVDGKEIGVGIVVVGGEKISVDETEFDVIEQALLWLHKSHMYDAKMKRIRLVKEENDDRFRS